MKYILSAIIMIGMLLACTPQTAGTVDDVGSISGQLLTGEGAPVDYAVTVVLYKSDGTETDAPATALPKIRSNRPGGFRVIETTTGAYLFDSIPGGDYWIEVSEEGIVVASEDVFTFVHDTPRNDTISVDEVMTLEFTVHTEQSQNVIIDNTIIENCRIINTDSGYLVKTIKTDEFSFKIVIQQENLAIDTVEVHAVVSNTGAARFEVIDSPVEVTISPSERETGTAVFNIDAVEPVNLTGTVTFGDKPVFAKMLHNDVRRIILTLSSPYEDTVRDTITTSTSAGRSHISAIGGLAAPATWLLQAAFTDYSCSPFCTTMVRFVTVPADTISTEIVLHAKYAILRLTCAGNSMPDDVGKLLLNIDSEVKAESTLTVESRNNQFAFTVDEIAADTAGIAHTISLQATGRYLGIDGRLLYSADTTIMAGNGSGSQFSMTLARTESATPAGMKLIKAGTFMMGPDSYDDGSHDMVPPEERTTFQATLTHDFWMDSTEVTQEAFVKIMAATYASFEDFRMPQWDSMGWGAGNDYPAHSVNWYEAALYCNALTKAAGSTDTVYRYESVEEYPNNAGCLVLSGLIIDMSKNGFHLPTEAQWEYACRAGTTTNYYFDSVAIDDYAWYLGNSGSTGHPVAQKLPNAFNIYDVCGNIREWCNDLYQEYGGDAKTDPAGPNSTPPMLRVSRGGNWGSEPAGSSSYSRYALPPDIQDPVTGFRVCLTIR